MTDAWGRARARYEAAHRDDDDGQFVVALEGYDVVLGIVLDADGVPVAELGASCEDVAVLAARAMLGRARCLFETTGELAGALSVLALAEDLARSSGATSEGLATVAQRGLLFLRSGDSARALAELDRARPELGDEPTRDTAVLLLNRGALHLEVGDVVRAEVDLTESVRHAIAIGNTTLESMARHNLGYLDFLRGDLPQALERMAQAERITDRGTPEAVTLLDRARVLYEAGLVSDAASTLERAEAVVLGAGSGVDLAQVRYQLARCLVVLRRSERAITTARLAQTQFLAQSNLPWARRAEIVALEAELVELLLSPDDDGERVAGLVRLQRRAGEIAAEVDGLAPEIVRVPALLIQAESAALVGDHAVARAALTAASGHATLPLSTRIQREAVGALLAYGVGDRRRGRAATRRGLALLSTQRAQLGSVDAVTAAAVHGLRLNAVDVEAALATGRAASVFDAIERGRATFAGSGRVRPPVDDESAELLAEARRKVVAGLRVDSLPERKRYLAQARALQDEVRGRSWAVAGGRRPPAPATARQVCAALSSSSQVTVVSLVRLRGRLYAVVLAVGRQQLVRLAPWEAVSAQVRRVRADLEVLANSLVPPPMRSAAAASAARAFATLDELVLAPLRVEGELHLVARDQLLTVPWGSLPSRRGRRTWVNSWTDLRVGEGERRSDDCLAVAGPGLRDADREARSVSEVWPRSTLLEGERATCSATIDRLGSAGVVHVAAHGVHVPDNPLFSWVQLADGPLFAHELDGTDLSGAVVLLAACEVGRSTPRVGGEPLGLTSVLLRHRARAVIAAVATLREDVAFRVMPKIHRGLRDGRLPGAALADAGADEPEPVPLVCFGPLVL